MFSYKFLFGQIIPTRLKPSQSTFMMRRARVSKFKIQGPLKMTPIMPEQELFEWERVRTGEM